MAVRGGAMFSSPVSSSVIRRGLLTLGTVLATTLAVFLSQHNILAAEVALPGDWYDTNLDHLFGDLSGPSWWHNYYDSPGPPTSYFPGNDVYDIFAPDSNHDYRENRGESGIADEIWGEVEAARDQSAGMAAADNVIRYVYQSQSNYEDWAYGASLGPVWTQDVPPGYVFDCYGRYMPAMERVSWMEPMTFAANCIREGVPAVLEYSFNDSEFGTIKSYLTIWAVDLAAGTFQASDPICDHLIPGAATYSYYHDPDGELNNMMVTGPDNLTVSSSTMTSLDVIAWWKGPWNGDWSDLNNWAAKHTPRADQVVYLNHESYTPKINVSTSACAKKIYFDSHSPDARINLNAGADMRVEEDVILGDAKNGSVYQFDGNMEVYGKLSLGQKAGSKGVYDMRGGSLFAEYMDVGGSGIGQFLQSGGDVEVQEALTIGKAAGGNAEYIMEWFHGDRCDLTAYSIEIGEGCYGLLRQRSGSVLATAGINVGTYETGRYEISGTADVETPYLHVGCMGYGSVWQDGGQVFVHNIARIGVWHEGKYELCNGSITSKQMEVGSGENGKMYHRGGMNTMSERLVIADAAGREGLYELTGGNLFAPQAIIGKKGNGKLIQRGAAAFATFDEESWIGYHGGSVGTYELRQGASLEINGDLHVSRTAGLAQGELAPLGTFVMDGSKITTAASSIYDPQGMLIAHGSGAKIVGPGNFDVGVVFESDPLYGAQNDQLVSVTFDRGSLTRANTFWVDQGLTGEHVGSNEQALTVAGHTLMGSNFEIRWRDPYDPTDNGIMEYTLTGPEGNLARPEIRMPYNRSRVAGNSKLSADDIEKRMYLWQFRKGIVRSVNKLDSITETPQIITCSGEILGTPQRIGGDVVDTLGKFNLAVSGEAVDPVHQDPNIAALHNRGLSGNGVKLGQLELGLPYILHGAFNQWDGDNAYDLRISVSDYMTAKTSPDAHANRVASIMIGYDPLGLQVDGLSHFADSAHRYNDGAGFVGVAPGATLHSRQLADENMLDAVANLVLADGCKVINASFGNKTLNTPGDINEEKGLDYWIADRCIYLTQIRGQQTYVLGANGPVYTQSVGNSGPAASSIRNPAGSYNTIKVGAAEFDSVAHPTMFDAGYASVAAYSSRGPTVDGRVGIDLVAQGSGNLSAYMMEKWNNDHTDTILDPDYDVEGNRGLYGTSQRLAHDSTDPVEGTSFSAPTVAGVAALMIEQTRNLGQPLGESPLVIKSVLMTSADKIDGWEKGNPGSIDDHAAPLDFAQGAGLLDPQGAVDLISDGRQTLGLAPVGHSGWAWDVLLAEETFIDESGPGPESEPMGHVYTLDSVRQGSSLTATLNWNRHIDYEGPNPDQALYDAWDLTNLDLALFYLGENHPVRIDWSESLIDNVEHLYIDMLPLEGDYALCVYGDFLPGLVGEEYALSWELSAVPEPGFCLILLSGVSLLLFYRKIRFKLR